MTAGATRAFHVFKSLPAKRKKGVATRNPRSFTPGGELG